MTGHVVQGERVGEVVVVEVLASVTLDFLFARQDDPHEDDAGDDYREDREERGEDDTEVNQEPVPDPLTVIVGSETQVVDTPRAACNRF